MRKPFRPLPDLPQVEPQQFWRVRTNYTGQIEVELRRETWWGSVEIDHLCAYPADWDAEVPEVIVEVARRILARVAEQRAARTKIQKAMDYEGDHQRWLKR